MNLERPRASVTQRGILSLNDVAQMDHIGTMNNKDAYIRARVSSRLKKDTERIFERLGLSSSDAIRLFLVQVKRQKGLPFRLELNAPAAMNDDLLRSPSKRQAVLDSIDED